MKLVLVSYATNHAHPGLKCLMSSAAKWGWDTRALGASDIWQGFKSKFRGVKAAIPQLRSEGWTHLCFQDSYDSIAVGPPSQFSPLEDRPGIVWGCEKACWPPCVDASRYPKEHRSEWRYLNSGNYFGSLDAVDEYLDADCLDCEDDQMTSGWKFIFDYESGNPKMSLDDKCEYWMTLAHSYHTEEQKSAVIGFDNGRWKNKITNTTPCFLHGNGRTDVEWLWSLS